MRGSNRLVLSCFAALLVACGGGGGGYHYVPPSDGGNTPTDGGKNCDASPVSCGGCTSDVSCTKATPRCDVTTNKCVACLPAMDNCGAGKRCVMQGGVYVCTATCMMSADCASGGAQLLCCSSACVDPTKDASNCGMCGKSCAAVANGTGACTASVCTIASCTMGYGDCNKVFADGCETALASDPRNCGACGNVCTLPNASSACTASACAVSSCMAGFGDCDKNAKNGCEADVSADVKNCGGCGSACPNPPHASPNCSNSTCGLGTCNNGFGDCDGNAQNGCEALLSSDPNNCGACNMVCNLPNATAGCAAGACTITACNQGFSDCDGMAANGCESNIATDAKNCGGCGKACANGKSCANGQCVTCNNNVLILGDDQNGADQQLVAALNNNGMVATLQAGGDISYAGAPSASNYGAVVILVGNNYSTDMPLAGQQSIVNASKVSTGVVFTEWGAYQVSLARWTALAGIMLLQRTSGNTSTLTFALTQMGHALWTGLPNSFTTVNMMGSNSGANVLNGGTAIASCQQCLGPGVVVRDNGTGRIVHIAHAGTYGAGNMTFTNDTNTTKLWVNAVKWAARCM